MSDAVKRNFQLPSFTATLMPFLVIIAFATLSVPGGLLGGWIGKGKVHLLVLGLTTLAVEATALKIRHRNRDLASGQ